MKGKHCRRKLDSDLNGHAESPECKSGASQNAVRGLATPNCAAVLGFVLERLLRNTAIGQAKSHLFPTGSILCRGHTFWLARLFRASNDMRVRFPLPADLPMKNRS